MRWNNVPPKSEINTIWILSASFYFFPTRKTKGRQTNQRHCALPINHLNSCLDFNPDKFLSNKTSVSSISRINDYVELQPKWQLSILQWVELLGRKLFEKEIYIVKLPRVKETGVMWLPPVFCVWELRFSCHFQSMITQITGWANI